MKHAEQTYDNMPLSERALLRQKRRGLWSNVRNDMGKPCEYWIYDADNPIGIAVYYRGRKLVFHGFEVAK